jgi:hypothetical protein
MGATTKSNIWHAGLLMGWVAVLEPGIVSHSEYNPGKDALKGWTPKGTTHTERLMHTPYSAALKQIIFECMYKDPVHRPDILSLKERVQEGWRAANNAAPGGEPWADFVHPDPDGPGWDPDSWDPNDDANTGGNNGAADNNEEDDQGGEEDEDEDEGEDEEGDEENDGEETDEWEDTDEGETDAGDSENGRGEDSTEKMEIKAEDNGANVPLNEQGRKSRCRIQ